MSPTLAVVGHVEWVQFASVDHLPERGEIEHADEVWEEPAGGGAVAAVQMAKLAGECLFITALGDDDLGHRAKAELEELGVRVEAAWRAEPQRRAFVHVDGGGERTITVMGDRMGPSGADDLPWAELGRADAVYLTAGDAPAVREARRACTLVATARAMEALAASRVEVDVLVASAKDRGELYRPDDLAAQPRFQVRTSGSSGGVLVDTEGAESAWKAAPLPGSVADAYGAGDSFAGGLTYGLGAGLQPSGALELAARCGAASMTGRGAYERQLEDPGL